MNILVKHISVSFLLFSSILLFGFISNNDEPITLLLSDESELFIKGSSTLHGWDSEATEFSVDFRVSEEWLSGMDNWSGDGVEALEVVVPVGKLESGRSRMNRDMREALNAEDYPEIKFTWDEINAVEDPNIEGRKLIVKGSLSIAGETREIDFEAVGDLVSENRIEVEGSYRLNMEDYNVDPPTAFLGTLRTDKMVEIEFNLMFEKEN